LLEAFAQTLLTHEVLERSDIERLVAEHEGAQPETRRLEPLEGADTGQARIAAAEGIDPSV
jgi:hypothetical protein